MANDYFDVKSWIKQYFNLSDSNTTLDSTNNSLEFIWVWSIFEHKYLRNEESISYNDQLLRIAKKFPVEEFNIDTIYGFLHNRYVQHGRTTAFFANLNFKPKWHTTAKLILIKSNPSKEEKLKLVLLVLYKFRCNLFHGGKDPLLWRKFDKVFFYLNKFLADFLDTKWELH